MSVPVETCTEPQVNYFNSDISKSKAASFTDYAGCQAKCAANAACRAWTLVDSYCFLKSSKAGMAFGSSAVSGPPKCEASRRAYGYEVLVTDSGGASVQFAATPCEFPLADENTCSVCGNMWIPSQCVWWACVPATAHAFGTPYCASKSMSSLPTGWITHT